MLRGGIKRVDIDAVLKEALKLLNIDVESITNERVMYSLLYVLSAVGGIEIRLGVGTSWKELINRIFEYELNGDVEPLPWIRRAVTKVRTLVEDIRRIAGIGDRMRIIEIVARVLSICRELYPKPTDLCKTTSMVIDDMDPEIVERICVYLQKRGLC